MSAAPAFLFSNNAITTLAAPIAAGDTAITLVAGGGTRFPSPGGQQQFALTLYDAATGQLNEIVYCTGRSGDVLTVIRAQEGTSARAWVAGDFASNFVTAGTLATFIQSATLPFQPARLVATGSANALVVTPSPAILAYVDGQPLVVHTASANTGAVTLNVSGLGTRPIQDQAGNALIAGMLAADRDYLMYYVATDSAFQLTPSLPTSSFISSLPAATAVTSTTMIPIDNGDGLGPRKSSVAQIDVAVQQFQFMNSFFLGMMG